VIDALVAVPVPIAVGAYRASLQVYVHIQPLVTRAIASGPQIESHVAAAGARPRATQIEAVCVVLAMFGPPSDAAWVAFVALSTN
jgi:hypothetical protein